MDFVTIWHQVAPGFCVAILALGLGALSWIDLKTGYLPFAIQIPLGVVGLLVAVLGSPVGIGWRAALIGGICNAGVFAGLRWAVSRWKQREAMGQGDVWLVGVGGLWLGPWALPYIMAIGGFGTMIGAALVGAIVKRPLWKGEMPLGPGLAAGILFCFVLALFDNAWLTLGTG